MTKSRDSPPPSPTAHPTPSRLQKLALVGKTVGKEVMRPWKLVDPEEGGLYPDLPGRGEANPSLIRWCGLRSEGPEPYFPTESPAWQLEFRAVNVV